MSADAEYGCDIGFDAGYQCGKDESARRVAELEAYNTTRTDELAAAARRIAELEAERHDLANRLTVALNKASWNDAAEKKIADLAECHGIDLRERDRRIHDLYTELQEWRNGERQYPPAVEDYKELLTKFKAAQFDRDELLAAAQAFSKARRYAQEYGHLVEATDSVAEAYYYADKLNDEVLAKVKP